MRGSSLEFAKFEVGQLAKGSRLAEVGRVDEVGPPGGIGPFDEAECLDEELYWLARGAGRLRLRIGQALHRLGLGYRELGFSTLGAYALERCSRGGRWAADSRALAGRLELLPHLSAALEAGWIGWSMAELLARHATPETEAALLEVARDKTVQAMRVALSPHQEPHDDDDDSRALSLTVPVEEAWALEATRMMVEHLDGKSSGEHWLEAVLAEGHASLLALLRSGEDDTSLQMEAEHAAWRAELEHLQHQHAKAELRSRPRVSADPVAGQAPGADDLPSSLEELDLRIRQYAAELGSRDLFFGRIARRFVALGGWQSLGFVSEAHYARERLGMSRASLRSKMTLARRTEGRDHLVDALQQGRIGFEATQLVARVATAATEEAWVDRAARRTFKHLREEVQWVELSQRIAGEAAREPPSEEQLRRMQALERSILSGELLRRVVDQAEDAGAHGLAEAPSSDAPSGAAPDGPDESDESTAVQISGTLGSRVTLRMRVPGDLLLHYRQLERLHRRVLPGESFLGFLCGNFWQQWVPTLGVSDKWESIYRRDRYRCTSPVCHQRKVTLHHVQYRAHGGDDSPDNLTCPCAFCHLEGEHGGRLKILPPGSNPTWLLGRTPVMRVQGRERILLA